MEKPQQKAETSRQLIELMLGGQSYHKAVAQLAAPAPFQQSRAYQLLKQARSTGQIDYHDDRHGHPAKFRPEITGWLKQRCQHAPLITSRQLQLELGQQFNLRVSKSQINRLRVQLEVANSLASRKLQGLTKKKKK
jgi:transposase